MADNIVQGLFGVNPDELVAQRNAAMQNQAFSFSQLDPQQQSTYGIYSGAQRLAAPIAGMMGLVNPQEEQNKRMQQVGQGADLTTPEGLFAVAQKFQDAGMPQQAYMAVSKANELKAALSKQAHESSQSALASAQAIKALRENPNIHEVEVGVAGKPDYRQKMMVDRSTGQMTPVGEPYQIPAGVRIDNGTQGVQPITIADPKDPNKAIVIDAKTGKKMGDSPKLTSLGANELKLVTQMPVAKQQADIAVQNMDRLEQAVNELDKHKGLSGITGLVNSRTPNVTDEARSAQAQLDSLKSQIFVTALQSMRAQSKTGGAVGNVSNREGDKLEATLGALKQDQGTKDFQVQLKKVASQVRESKDAIQGAYEEQFGHLPGYKPLGKTESPTPISAAPEKWTRNAQGQLVRSP